MKTYQDLRREVSAAAKPIPHPYKTYDSTANPRLAGKDHPYGTLLYVDGGAVAGKFGTIKAPRYLVARGADHEESIWGLAQELGFVDWGPDVVVEEIDADSLRMLAMPGGRLPDRQ